VGVQERVLAEKILRTGARLSIATAGHGHYVLEKQKMATGFRWGARSKTVPGCSCRWFVFVIISIATIVGTGSYNPVTASGSDQLWTEEEQETFTRITHAKYEQFKSMSPEKALLSWLDQHHNLGSDRLMILYGQIIEAQEQEFGKNDPRVIMSLKDLADRLARSSDFGGVVPGTTYVLGKSICRQREVWGYHNPITAASLGDLAWMKKKDGDSSGALSFLFQQAWTLRKLYPGCSEEECVERSNNELARLSTLPAQGQWFDRFAKNFDWKSCPEWLSFLGRKPQVTPRESEQLRPKLIEQLKDVAEFTTVHGWGFVQDSNHSGPVSNLYINLVSSFEDGMDNGGVKHQRLYSKTHPWTASAAMNAIDEFFRPGAIECTTIKDANGVATGFFLRIGDPATGKVLLASPRKAVVVCGNAPTSEKDKKLTALISRLNLNGSWHDMDPVVHPVWPVPPRENDYWTTSDSPYPSRAIYDRWHSPGFTCCQGVAVRFNVSENDTISNVRLTHSSGLRYVDNAALAAIKPGSKLDIEKFRGKKGLYECDFGWLARGGGITDWARKVAELQKEITDLEYGK
jgi:hypothetical protein